MRKWIYFLSALLILCPFSPDLIAGKALILTITGNIGPATQNYIQRGLAQAANHRHDIVILRMNTSGGLDSSMRKINESIINSSVPVITYVAPAGSRATGAGTFILYASHLAIMAPGTTVGAASPIKFGDNANTSHTKNSVMQKKIINDAASYIRNLAQLRGRNADWAELTVRHAVNVSAEEAKRLNVIDGLASDYAQLFQRIDGYTVFLEGIPENINTDGMALENMPPDWCYQFLSFLTHPNIAYVLVLVALYGLFFELANPGLVLPGVVGVICLLLALYALQLMPVNYAGLTLLLVGIGFIIFEMYVSSFGIIAIGGIIAFILGSILLFDSSNPHYQLSSLLICLMSIVTIIFFFVITAFVVSIMRKKVVTGQEGLIGSEGTVTSVVHEQATVRVLGEIWQAQSTDALTTDEKIKVIGIKGLVLQVELLNKKK
jgi:membrane-bound serine protease (ClpP class)